ncbi:MAG: hypothetical protein QOJ89_1238 [bacterium]
MALAVPALRARARARDVLLPLTAHRRRPVPRTGHLWRARRASCCTSAMRESGIELRRLARHGRGRVRRLVADRQRRRRAGAVYLDVGGRARGQHLHLEEPARRRGGRRRDGRDRRARTARARPLAGSDWVRFLGTCAAIWRASGPLLSGPPPWPPRLPAPGDAAPDPRALLRVRPRHTLRTPARAHARGPRLRMVIERFATYAGADPRRAAAALAVAGYVGAAA